MNLWKLSFSLRKLAGFVAILIAVNLAAYGVAAAGTPTVAILHPDVQDPFLNVFMEITDGIEDGLQQPARRYPVRDGDTPQSIAAQLKNDQIDAVICLGRVGLNYAKALAGTLPAIVGAIIFSPDEDTQGLYGISMTPDPDIVFNHLRTLVPGIAEVTVVYNPTQKNWEIKQAEKAAAKYHLTLNAYPAYDIRASAQHYRNVLLELKGGSISIWLPRDNIAMDEQALLPVVLREAWEKSFVIFSGNLEHVRKGALFSLFPNNVAMGRSLGIMALNHAKTRPHIEPLRDLLLAVNMRTAEHLGIKFTTEDRRKFDLTFPPPIP